jgi:hypothetical protein
VPGADGVADLVEEFFALGWLRFGGVHVDLCCVCVYNLLIVF